MKNSQEINKKIKQVDEILNSDSGKLVSIGCIRYVMKNFGKDLRNVDKAVEAFDKILSEALNSDDELLDTFMSIATLLMDADFSIWNSSFEKSQ